MEDHLAALHQALFPSGDGPSSSTTDLPDPFLVRPAPGDTPVKLGLSELLIILKRAVSPSPDSAPRLTYQLWSDEQLQTVVSLGIAIVSAARSLPLEQVEPVVVAVVQRLLEFAVCYLENSEFKGEEFIAESHLLLLMELALSNEVDTPLYSWDYCSLSSLLDVWQLASCKLDYREVDDCGTCGLQGVNCSKGEKAVDRLLMSFASERSQERQDSGSCQPSKHQDSIVFLCQHWAVVHVDSIQRLIHCCNKLIRFLDVSDDVAVAPQNLKRLSFSLRTFQLFRKVSEELPLLDHDASLLQEVASCTNAISCLFRTRVDIANNHFNVEGSLENLLVLLLEEFLCLIQVIFCSGRTFLNIQACILASIVGNLDSSLWRYNKDIANPKPPIVYSPRIVLYMLKLVKDLKKLSYQVVDIKHIDEVDIGSSIHYPSCHAHSVEVPLLKMFTDEELLKMVFAPSIQWIDHLMHLLLFLHNEGMKLRPRLEKAQSSVSKAIGPTDPESAVPHDDEALFGNLFSEGSRSVGSVDDQSAAAVDSCSSISNMPLQSASELLSFLKYCVFSREWSPSLFAEACKLLRKNHIDILLSVLNSRVLHSEGRSSDSCDTFQELCFDLLRNLLTCHVLTVPLEEYLIDRILEVNGGNFMHNKQTLCLLAYAIASRVGLSGRQLRAKLYKFFVDFMVDKATDVCYRYPNLEELVGSLPSVFHLEILLMAFHLSSEAEKSALAKLVVAGLQAVDFPPSRSSCAQLTCWAFLVSRLILLLRHMVAYPQSIPTSLLINLKSKWREAPNSSLHQTKVAYDQFSSWTSHALKSIVDPLLEEETFLRSLIGQLIEVPALPIFPSRDQSAVESLQLDWNDICAMFSNILGLWKGRKASCVEDLIVERYLFSLCSDIFMMARASCSQVSPQDVVKAQNLSNMACLFWFSCSIVGESDGSHGANLSVIIFGVLQHLCASIVHENVEELGWDFLRNGMWLSSILSLFDVGICGYCMKNKLSGVSPFWIEKTADDCSYASTCESLTSFIVETGRAPMLLSMLSSLLSNYLRVYQRAFFSTLNKTSNSSGFSSVLLLKHSCFEGCQMDELLKNSDVSSQQLKSVLDLLLKLDAVVNRGAPGVRNQVYRECLLHGFPSHLQVPGAVLVSSIVSIRGIASILDKFCRVEQCRQDICLDKEMLQQIVESVMTIKFDTVFQGLRRECDAIIGNLFGETEMSYQGNIFLLKQLEKFLSDFNAMKLSDTYIFERIIVKTIDTVESLRKHFMKSGTDELHAAGDDVLESASYLQEGDLRLLLGSLDHCFSESMNAKVLNFFVELLSGDFSSSFKLNIEEKFLEMDLLHLSKWLEVRLLGSIVESDTAVICAKGNSLSLRETTMKFILSLTTMPSSLQPGRLHDHIFEALLQLLDDAFLLFDVQIAMSFFHFVVQLATGEAMMRLLLNKTVLLMEKLAGDERFLPGLKNLFEFLGTVSSVCSSPKNAPGRSSGKCLPSSGFGAGSAALTSVGGRRNSETLVFSDNREAASTALEYDATSMDEDEDDGTSDGEVASIDKDGEEDSNSEKALASKVCTFTSSGSNFMEQHWYFCYTCDLTVSKGCCSICAKVCHRGHRVVYSRSSRFFCDCGAGGVRGSSCQCLKPRKFTESDSAPSHLASNFQSLLPFSEEPDHLAESDSDLDEEVNNDADNISSFSIPRELKDYVAVLFEELDVEDRVLKLCLSLLPSITSRRDANFSKDKRIILGEDKVLVYGTDLLQLKKAYKGGSFDLKIKTDYYNTKDLRSHLACGSLVKSLLSVSNRGRLAVGEGDKVAIYDVGQLIGQATAAPVTADKNNVKPVSRNIVRFEIVHLAFNSAVENYLAVAGYEDCQVLTLSPRGEVTDRVAIELALQGAYIRQIEWVPGSQVKLMVVTNRFIKIYDLSLDNMSPVHYFTLPDDMIVDATLLMDSQGRMFLIVLSEKGSLFSLRLDVEGNVGATPLKDVIQMQGREINAKGSSLYFSASFKILFVSYEDGTTLLGRLSHDATSLTDISLVFEEQDGKIRSAGLSRWKELLVGSGLFVCLSTVKPNAALAISMDPHQLHAQNMRYTLNATSHMVGLAAYKPLSKDKVHCLILHDDGSLQIYSHIPSGTDSGAHVTAEKVKKLGSGILNNKAYAGIKPEFPLDFFEKTICITADVKLGGDAIRNGDSEGAKQSLASEDGFLESPTFAGFKVTVSNSNPDIVMVGFRVHVGNTSANHIPAELTVFQRVVKLDEGMRSWYDVPFTVAESLLADEEFTISVGPTFNGTTAPRIDSLEIYGRAKDEFGWKEKMDALLDMESRVLGGKSLVGGLGKKCQPLPSSLIQEQVVADGLNVLSTIYSWRKSQEDEMKEVGTLRCKMLLDTIFESDREQWLQSAACRVLRAAFPNKEQYYQVKDDMRLRGVLKLTSVLKSRLGVGGNCAGWIVEEFTAQMRAVSNIASRRHSSLATFLEMNGSEVIDGLLEVLWGILEFEQPDTQTMNNIVISSVELIYCYAECLALHGKDRVAQSVTPAVLLYKRLLLFPNEAVQTSSSLAISSRLLQVPFPKQTILGTDDPVDSTASALSTEATIGGNAQVMIEEDSITSTVQYCCDGCSTVPILRRRWHCTVCPDFDLCEACYQVLDADRLPSPHSRDHPMTAIPIEVESLGDGSEAHFSTEDTNDSRLLPVSADASSQYSGSSIHVLEPTHSGGLSTSMTDAVSISASKQAVNSFLLSELLEQLKGWMGTTSGLRAIPIMQLFYRLSSSAGGPFINSSKPEILDLEKLIRWFLDEIDLSKPFGARSRSSFGEVTILVFMFFTLMLRNWHQPGSDSISKSSGNVDTLDRNVQVTLGASQPSLESRENVDITSQLLQACSCLRHQTFVNYLMDILQQLMHLFKTSGNFETSHSSNTGLGCGALLTIRRDLPAGNFSPFFSDSYAKAHRTDLFMDYHRLLLENAFRLVYSLVRPEKLDKVDKDKVYRMSCGKDLKLDGYQDVLCSYINNPHTTFVRRYARRLFLHLCGSKTHYYSVRDSWQFSSEVKKLYKHINKSGGLQCVVSYERSVKIVKCLTLMAEVAAARPRNWQKYCLKHGDVLPFLMNAVFYFGEESIIQTLKLLNLAFYTGKDMCHSMQKVEAGDTTGNSNKSVTQSTDSKKKKKSDDVSEDKSCLDMEAAVDIFNEKGGSCLRQFIDCFLLEWNSSSVRVEAKCVIYGAWHHGKHSFKEVLLASLLQKVKSLPMYGQNIVEFTELLSWFLGKAPNDNGVQQQNTELVDRCLTSDVVNGIFETLHSQNEFIANHPNSRIYNTLSGLVEFDGYYLESEPCVSCSSPEVPYSRMKLESLKSETKFTDNRIIVKCTGSYTIQTVTMNVHDARKSKSVKVLNLYYNNRPVADLSELKNNWSLWKRAKSCHLAFNQTELKVEFPIPITACNFMIELDSFYENLQALSLEPLQCPRCSRPVTDKHGICGNCHENAYQCRQCRNINYENLDSFLCNECGYSKYGRFEFNFVAKPSFTFDNMENDEDMKRGLAAIESESENAHRRYQQLLGFKKPLLKLVSSIGENEMDSQQKDSVQQMMVSLPGPSCKINRKIALLGVLYGEKCKAAFDSVSKSVQTLQGLRRVLMNYLHQKHSENNNTASRFVVSRSPNNCYGCATTFVTQCLEILQVLSKRPNTKKQLVTAGILSELFENNIHQGPKSARVQARAVLSAFSEGDNGAVTELNNLIQKKVMYCLEHHRSMDIALATREELLLLSEVCTLADEYWESRLRVVFQLLFSSIKSGAKHPAIAEQIILPCLRIISQACTPPKPDSVDKEQGTGKSTPAMHLNDENSANALGSSSAAVSGSKSVPEPSEKTLDSSQKMQDIQLLSYTEWEKGASYLDFVRRQYKVTQAVKGGGQRSRPQRQEYLALKYMLRWKRHSSKTKSDLPVFELGSWVTELILSACSQSIRSEMCMLISLLCAESSSRRFRLLNLLLTLLPATLTAGESAAEYFDLLFKMIDSEDARLFLTVRGCLTTICKLITQEVSNVEALERSLRIDISQGFILHKLIELLGKFLEVPNIRSRFMRDNLLSNVLEALIVIRGLIVQKTKLISDCNSLLKDLLDGLLVESAENKRQFIRACIGGLQNHGEEMKARTCLFILEQLCNLICPSKLESVYLLILNKAHTQEEFIRGSMTKNPYSSAEIGPLMRDVKNKICHQLDLLGLLEDDYGMELLVAGNIISLDLSIAQVYELVWRKSNSQSSSSMANSNLLSSTSGTSSRDCPPMTVTYRLQGLDGEATEPMIKELEEDREESQDPEVEFAIAGAVREYGGLEILMGMIQRLRDDLKSSQEQLVAVLNLLMHCCKIRENRQALLRLGALGLLLETARRAFSVDAMEPAEGILLIVESLTMEANESDNISITQGALTVTSDETGTGEQAKKIILMFLERLSHPLSLKKSNKQQRNTEMVARILPYLTYGEPAAMEALIQHFNPYLQNWKEFDRLQIDYENNPKDEVIGQKAVQQRFTVENFVRVSESLKTSSCGERLKNIILEKGITDVAVRHISESFTIIGQAGFKSTAEWSSGLKLPSVPLILSMLRGLSMGHLPTQQCIDKSGILPLLHALEGVAGENEIGAKAENLLDTLLDKEAKGDGFLEEKVRKLRHATKDEMRRRALRKREEMLQGLGMRQELTSDGGERIVVAQPILEGFEDVEEEEDGVACMVCREGYSLRPTDLLGVYSYSKRVNLGVGTSVSGRGGECVYTTVSYFNIIHFQCHQEAKRADAALRNPKKEWEGATLRNNESLCNSLFPVRGPSVPLQQYVRYVDQYWDNLNALGRADGSRLRLLTYDIVLMLARFATGASFSTESRGGGRESNSRFLPFMVQMARHLLEQGSASQRRAMSKAVLSYIGSSCADSRSSTHVTQPAQGTEETVQFMMVNSLLSESYESWLQHRRVFLQRGIYHAYMQHTHGRSSTTTIRAEAGSTNTSVTAEGSTGKELLSITRPMLVYTGLIEQLQRFFKVKKSANLPAAKVEEASGGSGDDEGGSMEPWEVVMKDRLLNVREMVGFSKELLTWLDEMNSATDLQEAFDVIGVLADVLSGGIARCEDFVLAAINTGKS